MLNLRGTTDLLEVVTGAAVALDVHTSWVDYTDGASTAAPNTTPTAITTAATTTIVAAPAASTTRNVKTVNIRNKSASSQVDVTVRFNRSATAYELFKVTLKAQETLQYIEGVGWFVAANPAAATTLFKILAADDAGGANVATAQPWFPTAGAVSVDGNTLYEMDGHLVLTRAAGATSHTTSLLFGGTATITSIQYHAAVKSGDVETNAALNATVARVATATVVKAASTSTTEAISIYLEGIIRTNVAGTIIPQFQYSAAPGGAPTIKANSYFQLRKLGGATIVAQGTWA